MDSYIPTYYKLRKKRLLCVDQNSLLLFSCSFSFFPHPFLGRGGVGGGVVVLSYWFLRTCVQNAQDKRTDWRHQQESKKQAVLKLFMISPSPIPRRDRYDEHPDYHITDVRDVRQSPRVGITVVYESRRSVAGRRHKQLWRHSGTDAVGRQCPGHCSELMLLRGRRFEPRWPWKLRLLTFFITRHNTCRRVELCYLVSKDLKKRRFFSSKW